MNKVDILNFMQDYLVKNTVHKEIAEINSYRVKELLTASIDAVDFAMELESFLGFEEDTFNIVVWVEKFEKFTFEQLAEALEQMLADLAG